MELHRNRLRRREVRSLRPIVIELVLGPRKAALTARVMN